MHATLLALLLASCARPVEPAWEAARAACGLEEGETVERPTVTSDPTSGFVYDEACALRLAGDLGMELEEFPRVELPGWVADTPLTGTIAGAYLLLGGDFGTVGALLADEALPASFAEELAALRDDLALGDADPAGRLLYEYAMYAVRRTRAIDADKVQFDTWTDTLLLPPTTWTIEPIYHMSTLAHEAGHHSGRSHDRCEGEGAGEEPTRDDTWDGAQGIEIFVVLRLAEQQGDDALRRDLQDVSSLLAEEGFCDPAAVPEDVVDRIERLWP